MRSLRGEGSKTVRFAGLGSLIGVAAAAAALVAPAGPAAAPEAAGAEQSAFGARLLTLSQSTMLRTGRARVRVIAPGLRRMRITAKLLRTGSRPRARRAIRPRIVRVRGRRTIGLKLKRGAKSELRACRGHRLTVVARPLKNRNRRVRASDIVRVDARRCDPARQGDVVGGDGPGGGGGGGDGGGRGSRGTIDVSNADRCDFTDPAVCLFPWPNDHFTVRDESTDTDRRLNLHPSSTPKNRAGKGIEPGPYNRNDGFSPGQKILTKVPGLESAEAFERTGAVPITELGRTFERRQPVVVINARTRERHLIWSEIDSNPAKPEDRNLIIRPATNLEEGERYIVALRDLRDRSGRFIEAHRGFAVYRDRIRTSEPAIESRRDHFESLFTTLDRAGIRRDNLYLAWDFTVASERNLSERALTIRDDAFAKLGDTNLADLQVQGSSPVPVIRSVEENPNDRIARRVDGSYLVPCYLDAPGCTPGSQFRFSNSHGPPDWTEGNMMEARFRCEIPKSAVNGPPARVALYGHGLLGSRDEVGAGNVQTFANEHNIMFCATDWTGMACADIEDNPGRTLQDIAEQRFAPPVQCDLPTILAILQDVSHFPKLADRVQQGLVNFLYLGRMMMHPDGFRPNAAFQVGAPPREALDTSRLYYDGNSQGGIIGGALTAVAVDHDRAVLGVTGMNYSTLLRRSVDFDAYAHGEFVEGADTPFGMYDNYPNELERPLMLSMIQILWDRAEANGYAHHMTSDPLANTPPHEVLMHVGLGDHQVAQVSAEVEARTIGASVREPYADPGRDTDTPQIFGVPPIGSYPFQGSAIVLWDTGPLRQGACEDGDRAVGTPPPPVENVPPRCGNDPHNDPRNEPSARLQKSEFMRIGGSVIDVCGTRPCYAGGWTGP